MSNYREPTAEDIGKIVEATDFGPEHSQRHWIKQRLMRIDWLLIDMCRKYKVGFPYFVCPASVTFEEAKAFGEFDCFRYARIETNS